MSDETPGRGSCYGHRLHTRTNRQGHHYLQSCVHEDVWQAVLDLKATHGISISGAAHHLMRLGAGLQPLPPLSSTND